MSTLDLTTSREFLTETLSTELVSEVSGGDTAVKEPGHFEVRKSSSQVTSPRVPDAAKGSPVLNDLTDLTSHLSHRLRDEK